MDRNVFVAIALSMSVLLFWGAFFETPKKTSEQQINQKVNIIIAGNNWGAGIQLLPKLKELSSRYSLSIFYAGGWAFKSVLLHPEPENRLKHIKEAFKKSS